MTQEYPRAVSSLPADSKSTFYRLESSVQSYARNFPRIFSRAVGAEIWDVDGNRYLDFLSGAGSLNYGHNPPELKFALIDYIASDSIGHSLDLHTVAKERFLKAINDIILRPRSLDYVVQFTGPTGTNAIEAALKLARKVTGRTEVVAFTNGFHGMTSAALAVTGNRGNRSGSGVPLTNVSRMPYDGYLGECIDTISYFEKMLNDPSSGLDHPAAVIVEVVQGEGGHKAASVDWMRRLRALCDAHEMLLIIDEIQTGCGRTGTFFSFEESGIVPDIVTMSKSISGYGLPLAIVLLKRELDVWKPGEHNGTFRGNNHAFITATAALEHYWRSDGFAADVQDKGRYLDERLLSMQHRFPEAIAEVRGRGMMRGLLFRDPKLAADVTKRAFKNGLIAECIGPNDEVIKCMMPLTIGQNGMDEGLSILDDAISAVLSPATSSRPPQQVAI